MILVKILGVDCKGVVDGRVEYTSNGDCPLARAINRRLKKGYYASIGGMGHFYIYSHNGGSSVCSGQADNFHLEVVENYGRKSRSFMRKLDIPAKFVKRTRYKELKTT